MIILRSDDILVTSILLVLLHEQEAKSFHHIAINLHTI